MATLAVPQDLAHRGTPMPLAEYLRTTFHPDRDFVDGVAEERPVPEWDHANLQSWLLVFFRAHSRDWDLQTVVECRLKVMADRFRVPDVMVLRAGVKVDRYPTQAPLICIEIISPEDTLQRLQRVVDDYDAMGVENIWAIDPEQHSAFVCSRKGFLRVEELAVEGTEIRLALKELFAALG